jgi:hypothetical protein
MSQWVENSFPFDQVFSAFVFPLLKLIQVTLTAMRIVANSLSFLRLANHSRALPHLRHTTIVQFSDYIHLCRSDIFYSPTRTVFSYPPVGYNKKSLCWIDSVSSNRTLVVRRYHKFLGITTNSSGCIRLAKSFNQSRKMVWITDLDNPKVF